ncbi:hypothetical protein ACS0TY_022211 [Phlomoides rotata]
MAKRRARIEECSATPNLYLFSNDYPRKVHQGWCFDEECRRIRMSRFESKPFSEALEALNSDNQRGKWIKNSGDERAWSRRVRTHFFCVGEIAKKLKQAFGGPTKISRSIDCIHGGGVVDATKNVRTKEKQRPLELEREREKIDLSEKDAILAANRGVCNRLIMSSSSLEHHCWDSQRISPLRMSTEMLFTRTVSSLILSTDEEAQDDMRRKSVETNNLLHSKSPNDEHSVLVDSDWENDFPSTPPSINGFNVCESSKYQEEYESPVSVLDQDNIHKSSSSSIIIFQTGMKSLKPRRRLCFEDCSDEQDCNISQYVHLVLKASSLNWDQMSTIRQPPLSEQVLHSYSHDFDSTRLLFDRINDVLLQIHRSHLLSATQKRRINHRLPLEQVVADEILREAEFYQTQERTLDQIVAKDVADRRLWFDLLLETQHDIIIHISQHILEESIVDVMLDIHC